MSTASAPKARGPYRTGIRRREQIVAAAVEVFAECGYAGGSIRAIALQAGVTNATLLQHFGTKEGLLQAVLDDWDRKAVEEALSDVTGLDYIRRLPRSMARHLDRPGQLKLFCTISAEATSPTHPAHDFIKNRYAKVHADLSAHLCAAVVAGDVTLPTDQIDREVRLLVAVLDGLSLQWLLDPETDLVGDTDSYVGNSIARWQRCA